MLVKLVINFACFFVCLFFVFCVGVNNVGTVVVCRDCDFNNIELCSLILVP